MTRTETIGKLNSYSVWYGLAFDKEGQLWGISGETYDLAYLYKIDRTTGTCGESHNGKGHEDLRVS